MDFLCPSCQKMLTVPDQYAGTKMKCPLCASQFTAPTLPSPASTPLGGGPFPPPPPPPPSVPMPPSMAKDRPPASPPPPTGEFRRSFGFSLDPRVVQWIAPAALVLLFVTQLFFSWVGMYPNGTAVYTQGAWGAAWGGGYREEDPLWAKMAEQNPTLNAVVVPKDSLPWQFLMVAYVLLLFPAALLLCIAAVVMPRVTLPLPPIVNQILPWRWAMAAAVSVLPFLALLLQMLLGFGLEQQVNNLVKEKVDSLRGSAAPGTPPSELRSTQPGTSLSTAPGSPAPSTETNEDKVKRALAESAIKGTQALQYTTWLKLTLWLHILAAAAAGLMLWLDRRTAAGKPAPRLDVRRRR